MLVPISDRLINLLGRTGFFASSDWRLRHTAFDCRLQDVEREQRLKLLTSICILVLLVLNVPLVGTRD